MPSKSVTSRSMPTSSPQRNPNEDLGERSGGDQLSLFQRSIASLIEDLHASLKESVNVYGGVYALASAMEKNHGEISLRINRGQNSKGEIQRATFDLLAFVCADPAARARFLTSLLERWGYKAPEPANAPTLEEKYRALMNVLTGETGEAVKERAARSAGFAAAEYRR
jgi:hypothetical protein